MRQEVNVCLCTNQLARLRIQIWKDTKRYQNMLELLPEESWKAVAAGNPVMGSVFVFGPSELAFAGDGQSVHQVLFSDSSNKHAQRYREDNLIILVVFFIITRPILWFHLLLCPGIVAFDTCWFWKSFCFYRLQQAASALTEMSIR